MVYNMYANFSPDSRSKSGPLESKYSIFDALNIIEAGVLAFALAEYYAIKLSNIVGVVAGINPTIFFDATAFAKIMQKEPDNLNIIKDKENNSTIILTPKCNLKSLSEKNIFKKFPALQTIIDENKYTDTNNPIENTILVNRCERMLANFCQWSDAGLPHIISSLQALQRHLAAKMKNPLPLDFESHIENGLSVEYQCELYANHLYGAKLLECWHHYLMSQNAKNFQPDHFLAWLKSLSPPELKEFGISSLDDISVVHYIEDVKERASWLLQFGKENSVINAKLPPPTKVGETIEIIYALGKSQTTLSYFYGGVKERGKINHSSFFAGGKVDGAGRILLRAQEDSQKNFNWVIYCVDDNSGHIKPDDQMSIATLERLQELGLNLKTIAWVSKWGTAGACDETADIALKRLKNNCDEIETINVKIPTESQFLTSLKKYAAAGALGAINDLVRTQGYKLNMVESATAAVLILKGLRNHLKVTGTDSAHPKLAISLADYALKFLRNSGKKSIQLENEFEYVIKQYKNNYLSLSKRLASIESWHDRKRAYPVQNHFTLWAKNKKGITVPIQALTPRPCS